MLKALSRKVIHFLEDPSYRIGKMLIRIGKPDWIPDKIYIKYQFHYVFGYPLNLKNTRTFNEKLQWLKLYDRNPMYTTLVDKYAVKKWVADRIGERYVIPTLGVYDSVNDIDLDELPNQFVLKCTHDSGSVIICKDKTAFDFNSAKQILTRGLNSDFYKKHREWPYKNVPRRIIAEQYMEDTQTSELRDYKFFCTDGICHALFVATDRMKKNEPYFDFYDTNFKHLSIIQGHPNNPHVIGKPVSFETMKGLASELSKGIPNVRCDFYEVNGRPFFGEMTFFHYGGLVPFYPFETDFEWGNWIKFPSDNA